MDDTFHLSLSSHNQKTANSLLRVGSNKATPKIIMINHTFLTITVYLSIPTYLSAFHVRSATRSVNLLQQPLRRNLILKLAKADDEEASKGMEDAFRQLDELKSLGDNDAFSMPEKKRQQDEAFAKAMDQLDLKDIQDLVPQASVESELALYSDMASEVKDKTEIDLIADLKSDMGGNPSVIPQFDPTSRDTEKFMEKALDEALEEAEKKADTEINKDTLLDNKEIMKEIEAIFDKANSELIEGLQEIREEQMALVKESAERNARQSQDKISEDQERLAAAEDNMRKMLDKVNEETKNVELAIKDLEKAQADMQGGVDDKLAGLKSGGLVKQATFVGALLFSVRSFTEGILYLGGDASHLVPAAFQALIALVCFAAFVFV